MKSLIATFALCASALVSSLAFADASAVTQCFGTEPFWSLTFSNSKIVFKNDVGDAQTMSILRGAPRAAAGSVTEYISLYQGRLLENNSRFMNVIIERNDCSDGMSDSTHPYSVLVLSGTSLFRGCCH